jgi:hypothetical protein
MAYQSVNPFNGEVLRIFDQHTDQQMEQMLVTADRAFRQVWSRKPICERAKVIGKAASRRAHSSRQRRGRGDSHCQRFSVRFGRFHLYQRHRSRKMRRQQNRNRDGLH